MSNSPWKTLPKLYYKCENLNIYYGAKDKILAKEIIPAFYVDIHNLYINSFMPYHITPIIKC